MIKAAPINAPLTSAPQISGSAGGRPTVTLLGAGAAGTLTALALVRAARRRSLGLDLVLLDPADRWARGVAFGTVEDDHLLNVPAAGMSALPEDPAHFVGWLAAEDLDGVADPQAFVSRRTWARYLDATLAAELRAAEDLVTIRHLRTQATGLVMTNQDPLSPNEGGSRAGEKWSVVTATGEQMPADAFVVATGLPQVGHDWAGRSLLDSPFFIRDPWAPGVLDLVRRDHSGPSDVLIVGTGLTMVDVVLTLSGAGNRPDRRLLGISRSGRLPRRHLPEAKLAAIPDISDWGSELDSIVAGATRHLSEVRAETGDWRPAADGLRHRIAELWGRLDDADRRRFVTEHAGAWGALRHRMPPSSGAVIDSLLASHRLALSTGEVIDAEPLPTGGLRVTFSDGTRHDVGWVINCTGPRTDLRTLGNPLLDDLLRPRAGGALATVDPQGLGLRTDGGRLLDAAGRTGAPVWTLGALRRGELWESTAVPEIRVQASAIATAILDEVAPQPRRLEDGRWVSGRHPIARPRDPLGLPLSTTAEAAAAFNAGLERVMRLQSGGDELIRTATELDPDFAVAHAALAMLGHEAGVRTDVRANLAAARAAIGKRGDAREAGLVEVVGRRVDDVRDTGATALMAHIAAHPRDVLAVSAAVPTIAFSGVTDVQREAWDLVEGLAPAYGDHWWYISLLAFTRQDQERFDDAGLLAESALSCEPSSGHAVHAQTHVLYETGQHVDGRTWLDHWVAETGRAASHRAHFSWHAALHELALGDTEAVRRRYYSQLAPPAVTGVRALIDSASLLWRWQLTTSDWDTAAATCGATPAFVGEGPPPPMAPILEAVGEDLVSRPQTPFVALHSAVALTAAEDPAALRRLQEHCLASSDPTLRTVVAPVCQAFGAVLDGQWRQAARGLRDVLPVLVRVGGSAAQREIVEEALLFCLINAGEAAAALTLLDRRLDRRNSPLDRRRRAPLTSIPLARAH
ncbi:FAD/NAD(P)-binding protein [Microlunatus soli]|uniref:Uncharacterized NAD(P)/FAD-binding protein YdhS n=1 Tax=Microlunatus soli TaxID=630515 RepID=A0A1H1MSF4_9ACTN|nr:FAD/NAD(P)-binding protein [Microlunatus soli]SDR89600.1 Uncharacterized NAD(P)/FAD-binding protein YdhS [Microlunatus soli]